MKLPPDPENPFITGHNEAYAKLEASEDCPAASCPAKNVLMLKWGTVKGWNIATEEAKAALQKWADGGVSMSAAMQEDSPEQKEALLTAMDHFDEFWLDWEGKEVTREEAKEYVRTYGQNAQAEAPPPQSSNTR